MVALTEDFSSQIQNRLPKKLKDLGSFTVQITIGQSVHARGLCYFGASINLMLVSLYKKLGLKSPKPPTVILQLANRSIARLERKFHLFWGHPFFDTGRQLIDVEAGELTMRAHDKVEVFDVYRSMELPSVYEELSTLTVVDLAVES
ncbi:uncharacterized protein LOC125861430 [Solanum stenotomum]|uniref:uncharacterized protein LOC125861430 n=1 Tax=Solanum stenotomum TaxID=172797 RepID=UPI0020D19E83|nr:uncharacterized protein LOC125861430 [Solanum stenotomum]